MKPLKNGICVSECKINVCKFIIMPENKYRVITRRDTMTIVSVVMDQSTTITSYPGVDNELGANHELHVVHNLEALKQGLVNADYNVDILSDYIVNNP